MTGAPHVSPLGDCGFAIGMLFACPKTGGPRPLVGWTLPSNQSTKIKRWFNIVRAEALEIPCRMMEKRRNATVSRWSNLRLLVGQLAFAGVILLPLFWLNKGNLLGYIDGQYLLTLIQNKQDFGTAGPAFNANPLQGLGDVWYFTNPYWIPEFLASRVFSDPSKRIVAIHLVALLEIFLATSVLSYWLIGSRTKAIASGWLAALVIFPISYPPLIYAVIPDAPQIAFLVAVPMLIVPLLSAIGRGSTLRDIAASLAIVFLMWTQFLGLGLFTALTYPFLFIVGVALLIDSRNCRSTLIKKVSWNAFIVCFLVITGLPQILLGFTSDTAFQFFPSELERKSHLLTEGSLLFRTTEPAGVLLAAGGLIGAIYYAVYSSGRMKCFAVSICTLAGLILFASAIYSLVGFRGAKPIYYEYVLWPIYPIFLVSIFSRVWLYLQHHLPILPYKAPLPIRKAAWIAAPLLGLSVVHGLNGLRGGGVERPNVFPPSRTVVTEYLRQKIGLTPDGQFNGRVATITGYGSSPDTSWDQAFAYDLGLIRSIGNEHRTIGMWYYNIPTLIEFNHAIRPLLFAVVSGFLARSEDGQELNILNVRRANLGILRLLGVRYVVTDTPGPAAGMQRLFSLSIPDHQFPLALDEVPSPDIGVSPTNILVLNGNETLQKIGETGFDFETTVIVPDDIKQPLTRATDVRISIERGAIRVQAASSGDSLVVIPFQFSHCLSVSSSGDSTAPTMIRADFLLTGIVFHGHLDAAVSYRQGPLARVWCGISDLQEDRRALQ
jgi:hypothetical protein